MPQYSTKTTRKMNYKKTRRNYPKSGPTATPAAVATALTVPQKVAVKKIIGRSMETKYVAEPSRTPSGSSTLSSFTAFSSGIAGPNEIYAALPTMTVGTSDHQRVGSRIEPVRGHVDLYLQAFGLNDNNSVDKTVHIFMLIAKSIKNLTDVGSIPILELLRIGNSTNSSFDGTIYRSFDDVSTNFRVLHHKKIRLVKGFGNPQGTTAATAGTTDAVLSPSRHFAHVKLNVPMLMELQYDNAASSYPLNYAPFFVIGWTQNIPQNAASSTINLQVIGKTHMYFKDS